MVAIGTSTGGPNALAAVIPTLPADIPVPILIVQHMPPYFTAALAERLSSKSAIKVKEAAHGDRLEPGKAWIAPGDYHMTVRRHEGRVVVELNQGPRENSCRPAVDVLLRSVASTYGAATLAVVMTGMGQDGLLGCELVRNTGGQSTSRTRRPASSGECRDSWLAPDWPSGLCLSTVWAPRSLPALARSQPSHALHEWRTHINVY